MLALLAACQPKPPNADAETASTVLVLGSLRYPVVSQAVAEIAHRNERLRGKASPLRLEFRDVRSDRDTDAQLRTLLPDIHRFKVIFTNSQTVARIAQLLAPDRPIVFGGVDDPVANCLVDSLAHPGRNATGYMHQLPDTEPKMLELLHDGFPGIRRVVVLAAGPNYTARGCVNASPPEEDTDPPCEPGLHEADDYLEHLIDAEHIRSHARRLGLTVDFLVLCRPKDFNLIRTVTPHDHATGILVPWHSLLVDHLEALIPELMAARHPAIGPNQRFVSAGGLMALEPILDQGRDSELVLTLLQVLDGREPANLPVRGPRGFEVTFNSAASEALGLRPNRILLLRADRIIP